MLKFIAKCRCCLPNYNYKKYEFISRIGFGGNGSIYMVREKSTNIIYTCKQFNNDHNTHEIKVLSNLPVKTGFPEFKEVITSPYSTCIILEYLPGEDLYDWFNKQTIGGKRLNTQTVKYIFHQMVVLTNELHTIGYVHLDIKLENFIISNNTITMIDFGATAPHNTTLTTSPHRIGGTDRYMSKEVSQNKYISSSDVWSLGVCLWILLIGEFPFTSTCSNTDYTFPSDYHSVYNGTKIESECFSLLEQMLASDYNTRISPEGILRHKWITS
jgi:serine/threonine protein kinase